MTRANSRKGPHSRPPPSAKVLRDVSGAEAPDAARVQARRRQRLGIDGVPPHLQYNKHIRDYYRPTPLSAADCVRSAFELHNETLNIVTHAAPLAVALPYLASLLLELPAVSHAPQRVLLVPVVACSVLVLVASAGYHIFMAAPATEKGYQQLLFLDVFGIWVLQASAGTISALQGFPCAPVQAVAAASLLAPAVGLALLWRAQDVKRRALAFAVMTVWRQLSHVLRAIVGTGAHSAMWALVAAEVLVGAGGLINAARWPERVSRWWDTDLWLNSHNLMHVLTALGMACLCVGVELDARFIEAHPELQRCATATYASWHDLFSSTVAVATGK